MASKAKKEEIVQHSDSEEEIYDDEEAEEEEEYLDEVDELESKLIRKNGKLYLALYDPTTGVVSKLVPVASVPVELKSVKETSSSKKDKQ